MEQRYNREQEQIKQIEYQHHSDGSLNVHTDQSCEHHQCEFQEEYKQFAAPHKVETPEKYEINQVTYRQTGPLSESKTNKTFNNVNRLTAALHGGKEIQEQELNQLCKFFNVIVPKKADETICQEQCQTATFLTYANEMITRKLYKVLNQENGGAKTESTIIDLKYFVGPGNNAKTVKEVLKRRSWWQSTQLEQDRFDRRDCHFIWTQWYKPMNFAFQKGASRERKYSNEFESVPQFTYNKLEQNYQLADKTGLFKNMCSFYEATKQDPFEKAFPLTFNPSEASDQDLEFCKFRDAFEQQEQAGNGRVWILKPGEDTNRGNGIVVSSSFAEITTVIGCFKNKTSQNHRVFEEMKKKERFAAQRNIKSRVPLEKRTWIVQKYIENPLLFKGRKFDIRVFALITSINGFLKAYLYQDCYFRTSAKEFTLQDLKSVGVHLTNDSIQKNQEDYGQHESENKLSISEFQTYLDRVYKESEVDFRRDLWPQIERLVTESVQATAGKIDPNRIQNCFEILGYDFMVDENLRVYLIEVNTNPSLTYEKGSSVLTQLIPEMLDNTFRIALDPIYQPQFLKTDKRGNSMPKKLPKQDKSELCTIPEIKYNLIFDSRYDRSTQKKTF